MRASRRMSTSSTKPATRTRPGSARQPFERKGAGNARCFGWHPQPGTQEQISAPANHHRYSRVTGIPCAMVYGLYRDLPGETELRCLRHLQLVTAGLAPASGRQNHTALLVRSPAIRRLAGRVHRIPLPTFVTTAIRPFSWRQDSADISAIRIFSKRGCVRRIWQGGKWSS